MEGSFEQVTPAAPAGDAGSSPASGADLGAATGAPAPSAAATPAGQTAQPQIPANAGADAVPGAPANPATPADEPTQVDPYALPEQEAQARMIGRERFDSLHQGYKALETDHRTLKTEYETTREKLAAFDAVGGVDDAAQIIQGLTSYATDPQTGELLRDANGNPYYDTASVVGRLQELDQSLLLSLTYDAMQAPFGDGRTVGEAMAEHLGWQTKPEASQTQSPPVASVNAETVALVKEVFPQQSEAFEKAFKGLTPAMRETVSNLLGKNTPEDDAEAQAILAEKHRTIQTDEYVAQQQAKDAERVQFGLKQFQQQTQQYIAEQSRSDTEAALSEISKQLEAQVTFSPDPQQNQFQKTAVNAFLASLVNPATRFVVEPILQQMGAQLPPGFWERYEAFDNSFADFHRYTKLNETIKANAELAPHLSKHRNDLAMNKAKATMQTERRFVVAGFNEVALKVAKAITVQLEQSKAVGAAISAAESSRPNVNGQAGAGVGQNGRVSLPSHIQPFTPEAIAWERQQRQGA